VDDGSSDNTPEIASQLCSKYEGVIDYVRNSVNRKQAYSKNRGKAMAVTQYIYFGDDDSVLVPGSIEALLQTVSRYDADIVGAIALYCLDGMSAEERYREYLDQEPIDDPLEFVDLIRLQFTIIRPPMSPISLPVMQACFLIRREWYQRLDFDLRYTGNCFREETDFLLQAHQAGARIVLDGRAVQINLAPSVTAGGARSASRLRYEWQSLMNTGRFLRKHRRYYREQLGKSICTPMFWYMRNRIGAGLRRVTR
jgi:glycosyltransferase involved in cell wall biosynthesis